MTVGGVDLEVEITDRWEIDVDKVSKIVGGL
jgi:hypothetical protein